MKFAKKKSLRNNLCVFANQFGNESPEASCLGEHGVAVSTEIGSLFPGRSYTSPSLRESLLKRHLILGLSSRYAPRDKMPQ